MPKSLVSFLSLRLDSKLRADNYFSFDMEISVSNYGKDLVTGNIFFITFPVFRLNVREKNIKESK